MPALHWLLFEVTAAALLLLPGGLLARRIPLLWRRIGAGERILPAFLLSIGVAGVAYVIASRLRPTVDVLVVTWIGLTAALLLWNVIADLAARRGGRSIAPAMSVLLPPGGRGATLSALAVTAVGFASMVYAGGGLGVMHDSLEFVAFVQRMLLQGRIDLVSGAFRDVADLGPDPRRGLFHFFAVIVCRLSGASAVEMWRWLPAALVPISFWISFAAMRRILQSAPVALAGLAVFAVVELSSAQAFLNNLAYASRIGWVYSWVGLWAVALSLDARRADGSGRAGRAAELLAIAAAPILLGVHVYSAAQYLVALAAGAWTWALLPSFDRSTRRSLFLLPVWATAAAVPVLLVKILQSYTEANGLFDHAQGLLYIAGDWAVLAPRQMRTWFGLPGFLAVLLTFPLLPQFRRGRDRAFLVGSTLAVLLIVLNPVAVRLVEAAGAHTLLFRILLVAPWFQVLGWYLIWIVRPEKPGSRWSAAARVGCAVLIAAAVGSQVAAEARRGGGLHRQTDHWAEFPAVQRMLRELDRMEPAPQVVVSDPLTSYFIPSFSRHYAIAPFSQHSSPADGRTIERIQDARAVLNPLVGMEETVRLLREYGARYVLVNQSLHNPWMVYYAPIDPAVYQEQREKFAGRPDLFRLVEARDEVFLYCFEDPGPDWHDPPSRANPYLTLGPEEAKGQSRAELAARLGLQRWDGPEVGGMELIGIRTDSLASPHPGDDLKIVTYWRRTERPYVLPVAAFVRMQTAYPDRRFDSPLFGRLYRAWYESRHWVSHRFGRDLEPLGAEYPAFLWEPGAVYRVPLTLPVLINAPPGDYALRLLVRTIPFEPNLRLKDLFTLKDSLEGTPVAEVRIQP